VHSERCRLVTGLRQAIADPAPVPRASS
jgi:hypothetical protein